MKDSPYAVTVTVPSPSDDEQAQNRNGSARKERRGRVSSGERRWGAFGVTKNVLHVFIVKWLSGQENVDDISPD